MKNLETLIQEYESTGYKKYSPAEPDNDLNRVSTFTERIMEECEFMIRRIDHVFESAKETLEISFDKKEMEPEVYFTLSEIRLQNYLKLISKVEARRDTQLADRWGL